MLPGQLTFSGNFNNDTNIGKVSIRKDAAVSLKSWFEDRFRDNDRYQNIIFGRTLPSTTCPVLEDGFLPARWVESEDAHQAYFSMREFFSAFLGRYEPSDLALFLEDAMVEKADFDNQTLLSHLRSFVDTYAAVKYIPTDEGFKGFSHFLLKPIDNTSVKELHEITRNNRIKFLEEVIDWFKEHNPAYTADSSMAEWLIYDEKHSRYWNTTKPYSANNGRKNALKSLLDAEKPFIFVADPFRERRSVDYFSIIKEYNLPTEHLDIVLREE